jgi:hypothetical protein
VSLTKTVRLRVLAAVGLLIAAVALVAVVLSSDGRRPMNSVTLADALEAETGVMLGDGHCRVVGESRWRCSVPDQGGSGFAEYVVAETSDACWEAVRVRMDGRVA